MIVFYSKQNEVELTEKNVEAIDIVGNGVVIRVRENGIVILKKGTSEVILEEKCDLSSPLLEQEKVRISGPTLVP